MCTHPELLDPEALGQGDLEDLQAAHVGRQPGQALLAAAAHSDQEGRALGRPEDSADATPGEKKCTHRSRKSGTRTLFIF